MSATRATGCPGPGYAPGGGVAPHAEEIERWNEDRPVPPGAYSARVRLVHPLRPLAAGTAHHVQVEVTNLGDTWWPRGPEPRPEISRRAPLADAGGCRARDRDAARRRLRRPWLPGATTRLTVPIQAPPQTGELELVVDVVHEWVRWFDCAATQRVTVTRLPTTTRSSPSSAPARAARADAVLPPLLELVPARSLVDVGCGLGTWLRAALDLGVGEVAGVDGDWVDPDDLEVPAATFRAADIAEPLELGRRYDLALSLEVGRAPSGGGGRWLRRLARRGLAPVVAFSAAIPGQGGDGHLNEQWPAYWAELFEQHGYEPVDALRPRLWDDERVEWWYAQNLVVYASRDALGRYPALAEHPRRGRAPLALVHPRRFAGEAPDPARAKVAGRPRGSARHHRSSRRSSRRRPSRTAGRCSRLHAAVAERGPFRYLEIGSHLGGSLQALVADPRCMEIVSIDTRPDSQPDDRGRELPRTRTTARSACSACWTTCPSADHEEAADVRGGDRRARERPNCPATPDLCLNRRRAHAAARDGFCPRPRDVALLR